jgi:hypothetical protein
MAEKGEAATGEYYFGTSAVNGSTVQQHVVNFETTSSSVSYVPTVGLQYGKSYSVGAVSCTQSTLGASDYLQTCTVTVTFAPLYPGGHRDAIFVFDADGKTQLVGAFLYGIGLAPQLMIQPGVTTSQNLSGSPYLYGSATDDAGTYYVYSNSSIYTVKEGGVPAQYIKSFPVSYGLSIDGAGNLFSPHNNINTSGYEWEPSADAAYDVILSYTTLQDPTQNPQIVPCTTIFDDTVAVAAGNLGTYYDADSGGESCRNITWQQGLLLQPYGTQSPVTSPPGPPPEPNNVVPPYGDQPAAYPLHNGNYSPSSMLVDSYENLFFNGNSGMAVWCGLGTPGLSSAVTGSTTGCAAWGTSMVALNATTGGNMAADAADTVYIGQGYNGSTAIVMYSASNNYATPLAALGVAGGPGNVSMAPDGTVYAQGGGTAIVAIDRSQGAIDFGSNNGQTSNPYTMTLYNGGNQPLTISSIAASGAGFSVAPTTTNGCTLNGVTVAVGTICQLQVSFTQAHTGTSTGAITITSNSLNHTSTVQTIALSAELPGIYVSAAPTPLAFGYVAPGSSTTLPVTLTNGSLPSNSAGYGSTVAINSALSSSNPAYTVSPGTCSAPLASGASCQLQVTFNSGTTTTYPGTISWTEQITGGGPSQQMTLPVTATGINPVVVLPPDYETIHVTDLLALVPSTLLPDAEAIHIGDQFSLVPSTLLPIDELITVSDGPSNPLAKMPTIFVVGPSGVSSLLESGSSQSAASGAGGIGAAVDAAGDVWSIDADGAGISKFSDNGALIATYTNIGLSGAVALCIDGNSDIWIANGNGNVVELSNAGAILKTIENTGLTAASGISIDTTGNIWLTNAKTNSVTQLLGTSIPTAPLAIGVLKGTPGTLP